MIDRPRVLRVFVGSSVEGLAVARQIQACFDYDRYDAVVWENGVFEASATAIESLAKATREFDFAVFVLTPDDLSLSRDVLRDTIRDNIVFESGLFMGAIGRNRVFFAQPRVGVAWPTDWSGITPLTYDHDRFRREPAAAIAPLCLSLRSRFEKLGGV
jgi:predicted nucleotide-binding protein